MKSLEARISALEALKPAPNVTFVVSYRKDGTLVPLRNGNVYGRHCALIQEPYTSAPDWLERFTGDCSWERERAIMAKAEKAFKAQLNFRQRDGNQELERIGR